MKTKKIPALLLAMSIGMSPAVFANMNHDKVDSTKTTSKTTDAYHNSKQMNDMNETESSMINNRNYNKRSAMADNYADKSNFMKRDIVKKVQEKLNDNNFSVGSADGVYGPKTRSALMDYQRSEDLEVTGRLNQQTLNALEIDSSEFSRSDRDMYSE